MSKDVEKRLTALENAEKIIKFQRNYMNLMDYLDYESDMDFFTEDANSEVCDSGVNRGKRKRPQKLDTLYPSGYIPYFHFNHPVTGKKTPMNNYRN